MLGPAEEEVEVGVLLRRRTASPGSSFSDSLGVRERERERQTDRQTGEREEEQKNEKIPALK